MQLHAMLISGLKGEWFQPTQASMAIYNDPSKNIFLQLQDEPLASKSEDETYELPPIPAFGPPDDTSLVPADSSYLHFFINELPSVLSIDQIFPSTLVRILGMTLGSPGLWHSVLAVSSFFADKVVGRPTSRMYFHLHHALSLIQSAIKNNAINDTHIVAVFLLAYLNLATGEITSAGRHLDGLQVMLEQRATTADENDPLINAIRRLSIRLDNVRGATGRELAFATHKLENGVSHRDWLTRLIEHDRIPLTDWAIAEFELEDLANQMIHLHLRARNLRSSPTHNPETDEHELLFRVEVLLNDLRSWKSRPIFMAAEASENVARLASLGDSTTPSFLHYPPLMFRNVLYASLLIMYYRLELLGSLIVHPQVGPHPVERVDAAVTLCRTFASFKALRGKIPSLMVIPLTLAGFVLGETTHPQGISSFILSAHLKNSNGYASNWPTLIGEVDFPAHLSQSTLSAPSGGIPTTIHGISSFRNQIIS
jgi:hypothetical protein